MIDYINSATRNVKQLNNDLISWINAAGGIVNNNIKIFDTIGGIGLKTTNQISINTIIVGLPNIL